MLGLAAQESRPDEVLVVWQAGDTRTRDVAEILRASLPFPLRVLHCPEAGIVPAENRALAVATGQIVLLVDDDVIVPTDWVARHLAHYDDPTVGAVGGPVDNILSDGTPLSRRAVEPLGRVTWYGRVLGNLHDQPPEWRGRPPREVDHLAGGNLSLRRSAFRRFEGGLKEYWQTFELDACLQAKADGFRVIFDFANVVRHYPTSNLVYQPGREGDLGVKVFNAAYNRAFVLAKHSPWYLRYWRLLYLSLVDTVDAPGPLALPASVRRHGDPWRELKICWTTWGHRLAGWKAGTGCRRRARLRPRAAGAGRGVKAGEPEEDCLVVTSPLPASLRVGSRET